MQKIVLIIIGVVCLFLSLIFYFNPAFASNYIKNSPKAWLWRKLFGEEKALKITKYVFVPIGIIIGIIIIIFGFIL